LVKKGPLNFESLLEPFPDEQDGDAESQAPEAGSAKPASIISF
jgi:hypothetical protein